MILNFSRPSVGARIGSGNVVSFGIASQGAAPTPPVVGTGYQHDPFITTATYPRPLRFGRMVYGTAGQAVPVIPKVGSLGRRRRQTIAEFEEGRERGFSRTVFEEFQAAQRAAKEAALEAKKKASRKALERATDAAAKVAGELDASDAQVDLRPLTASLDALSGAKNVSATIAESKNAIAWAHKILADMKEAEDADEDDAMTLLMLS